MKVEKRIVKMPPPYATASEAKDIKHALVNLNRSFSAYAIEAVMEKLERDGMRLIGTGKILRGSPHEAQ